jgi:hypothetical protein
MFQLDMKNPGLLDGALSLYPMQRIYGEAEEERRLLYALAQSKGKGVRSECGYQDCVITVMRYVLSCCLGCCYGSATPMFCILKQGFFLIVVNNPHGTIWHSPTVTRGMTKATHGEKASGASRVEVHQCPMPHCLQCERLPRYTDVWILDT